MQVYYSLFFIKCNFFTFILFWNINFINCTKILFHYLFIFSVVIYLSNLISIKILNNLCICSILYLLNLICVGRHILGEVREIWLLFSFIKPVLSVHFSLSSVQEIRSLKLILIYSIW